MRLRDIYLKSTNVFLSLFELLKLKKKLDEAKQQFTNPVFIGLGKMFNHNIAGQTVYN